MFRLALVIEFLPDSGADFLGNLAGIEPRAEAAMESEGDFQLLQIGLHGRLHVGILKLAGEGCPIQAGRAMDLAEGGGGGGPEIEGAEPFLPIGSELGHHPALDEGRSHGRRVGLQFL